MGSVAHRVADRVHPVPPLCQPGRAPLGLHWPPAAARKRWALPQILFRLLDPLPVFRHGLVARDRLHRQFDCRRRPPLCSRREGQEVPRLCRDSVHNTFPLLRPLRGFTFDLQLVDRQWALPRINLAVGRVALYETGAPRHTHEKRTSKRIILQPDHIVDRRNA